MPNLDCSPSFLGPFFQCAFFSLQIILRRSFGYARASKFLRLTPIVTLAARPARNFLLNKKSCSRGGWSHLLSRLLHQLQPIQRSDENNGRQKNTDTEKNGQDVMCFFSILKLISSTSKSCNCTCIFCLYYRFCFRPPKLTANVLRLKNVAKAQHQAFTNITKTLN